MTNTSEQGWFTRERILTALLAAATILALYVCYLIILPFFASLAFALALAIATQRPYLWLRSKVGRDSLAAGIAVVFVTLLVVGPVAALLIYMIQQGLASLNELQQSGIPNWRNWIAEQPHLAAPFHWVDERVNVQAQLEGIAKNLAGRAGGLLNSTVAAGTSLVITMFVLFFLYRDREGAMNAFRHLMPLAPKETKRLSSRVADTILATVNGSLTVAFAQATIAGLMYWFLGVPLAVLWAAATFFMALVPVFGTFVVWAPIATYLALTGSWGKALILVGWGILAVGTIDNILYPYLVGDRLRLHTVPTFFAILGGITLFGPAGLIFGPVVLAVTIGLLDIWWCRTAEGEPAEDSRGLREDMQRPEGALEESQAES